MGNDEQQYVAAGAFKRDTNYIDTRITEHGADVGVRVTGGRRQRPGDLRVRVLDAGIGQRVEEAGDCREDAGPDRLERAHLREARPDLVPHRTGHVGLRRQG